MTEGFDDQVRDPCLGSPSHGTYLKTMAQIASNTNSSASTPQTHVVRNCAFVDGKLNWQYIRKHQTRLATSK